ncbi:MAG: FAD-binding protein [Streptosporangiales bacterium]|nr:FAD-binding protein [Streptosporangiales bacterium]
MGIQTLPTPTTTAVLRDLRAAVAAPVLAVGDAGYDEQRATWAGAIDPRPAAVVLAATAADIRTAVLVARTHDLPFAVQSTGHGTYLPCDGGVLVKTAGMDAVRIDPAARTATVGPGVRWSAVIAAAEPYGLAPVSGTSSSVGVAGYTLGGGMGWLSRRFGFAGDNVVRVELVTADGRLVTASADEYPDLFWAVRGAGANFGVVTSLEFRLHPVSRVYAGAAYYPLERAADVLDHYRGWAATQPAELSTSLVVMRQPPVDVPGPVLAIRGAYVGSEAAGRGALAPLRRVAGRALADTFVEGPYADVAKIGGTPSRQFELFTSPPDVLAELPQHSAVEAVEVRYWGGAMAQPAAGAGPVGHREVPFSATVHGPVSALAPVAGAATGGSFLNFLHEMSRTADAYTPADYRRLRALKAVHDPDNVFGRIHNIPPAGQATRL